MILDIFRNNAMLQSHHVTNPWQLPNRHFPFLRSLITWLGQNRSANLFSNSIKSEGKSFGIHACVLLNSSLPSVADLLMEVDLGSSIRPLIFRFLVLINQWTFMVDNTTSRSIPLLSTAGPMWGPQGDITIRITKLGHSSLNFEGRVTKVPSTRMALTRSLLIILVISESLSTCPIGTVSF